MSWPITPRSPKTEMPRFLDRDEWYQVGCFSLLMGATTLPSVIGAVLTIIAVSILILNSLEVYYQWKDNKDGEEEIVCQND